MPQTAGESYIVLSEVARRLPASRQRDAPELSDGRQIALAVALLTAALSAFRGLRELLAVDLGLLTDRDRGVYLALERDPSTITPALGLP